jgi:hypothetical protein
LPPVPAATQRDPFHATELQVLKSTGRTVVLFQVYPSVLVEIDDPGVGRTREEPPAIQIDPFHAIVLHVRRPDGFEADHVIPSTLVTI